MEHEVLFLLAFIALKTLSIVCCSQGGRYQGLRLSAGEECRAMRAWQNACLDRDLANLVESAAIGTNPVLGHLLAESPFAKQLVIGSQLLLGIRIVGRQLSCQFVLDLLHQCVAVSLGVLLGVERILEAIADLGLQLIVVTFVRGRRNE